MIEAMRMILQSTVDRLSAQAVQYLPSVLASLIILASAWIVAAVVRLLVQRAFHGAGMDRFLKRSGLNAAAGGAFSLGATRLVAGACYWGILLTGAMTALSTYNSALIARLAEQGFLLLPRLITAAAIMLAGLWLAQYLSRSALIWACNQRIASPQNVAGLVRIAVISLAVVVTADYLDFARGVFLSAFVICLGGLVLALSLAIGLGRHEVVDWFCRRAERAEPAGREWSLWNHL